jgi:signal transduction histidine kinase
VKIASKLILKTCITAVLLSIAAYLIFSNKVKSMIKADLQNKTNTILKNLAYNSEYSVIIKDTAALEKLLEGALCEKDISFIAIEDARGRTIVKKGKSGESTAEEYTEPIVSKLLFTKASELILNDGSESADIKTNIIGNVRIGITYSYVNQKVASLNKALLFLLFLIVLFTVFNTIIGIYYFFTRPLKSLVYGIQKIKSGNLAYRINPKNNDEIGGLAQSFNAMTQNLSQTLVSKSSLEAVVHELESFSYFVSHDLKAPLKAIDGFSKMLLEYHGNSLNDEGKKFLSSILASTKEMEQLINNLLSFSHAGSQELLFTSINMEQLANNTIEKINHRNRKRPIEFKIGHMPPAFGDPSMISQVFINLLSNAVKFTSVCEKAAIEIGGLRENNRNIYYIKDNGIGFDMQYYDKLFKVFQRLHSHEDIEGNGIGLAIVKRIINRHGGDIWAESEIGQGATFFFSLPLNH